jgi:carboxyl-terminal processing protease
MLVLIAAKKFYTMSRMHSFFKTSHRNIFGILLVALSLGFGGCRKDIDQNRVTSYYGMSYSEVFESFWNGMNTNYIFWDIEKVDWNNMYKTYKPRFEYLDAHKKDPNTVNLAAQYLVDMTKDLSDSHFSLNFNGGVSYVIAGYPLQNTNNFSPSSIRHQLRGDRAPIPRSTFDVVIPQNYLTKAQAGTDGNSFRMNLGIIPRNNKNILYLEYSAFQLKSQYWAPNGTTSPVKPVLDEFFRYTKDPDVDGLIIDLRGNPGGSVPDLDFLLGRLITSPVHVSYTRTKNGNGRLDLTPWIKGYVHPQPGGVNFNKPVAVMVDSYSASMSEMTSIASKAVFDKVKIVGETTWGGTGQIPSSDVKYLGGQFTAANFVQVYMAGVEFRDKNLVSYENKGITPDIRIAYDTTAIKRNVDVQLDKALEYVISQ